MDKRNTDATAGGAGHAWGTTILSSMGGLSNDRQGSWKWICGSILAGGLIPCTAADPSPEAEADYKKTVAGSTATAGEAKPADGGDEKGGPEHLLKPFASWRQRLSAQGIDFNLTYSAEVIGNAHGGVHGGSIYEGLLKSTIDFDGEKLIGWKGGTFHVSGLYAHGSSPSTKLAGDLLTLSNLDAYDSPRLFEFWFQQELFDGKFSIRAGQLAADEEFAATEYGAIFLHGTTGWPGMIALNARHACVPGCDSWRSPRVQTNG